MYVKAKHLIQDRDKFSYLLAFTFIFCAFLENSYAPPSVRSFDSSGNSIVLYLTLPEKKLTKEEEAAKAEEAAKEGEKKEPLPEPTLKDFSNTDRDLIDTLIVHAEQCFFDWEDDRPVEKEKIEGGPCTGKSLEILKPMTVKEFRSLLFDALHYAHLDLSADNPLLRQIEKFSAFNNLHSYDSVFEEIKKLTLQIKRARERLKEMELGIDKDYPNSTSELIQTTALAKQIRSKIDEKVKLQLSLDDTEFEWKMIYDEFWDFIIQIKNDVSSDFTVISDPQSVQFVWHKHLWSLLNSASLAAPEFVHARLGHTAIVYKDSMIICGGKLPEDALDSLVIFNFKTKEWRIPESAKSGPTPCTNRIRHRSLLLEDGKMLISGGSVSTKDEGGIATELDGSTIIYDINKDEFLSINENLYEARAGHLMANRDGNILILGGQTSQGSVKEGVQSIDGRSAWVALSQSENNDFPTVAKFSYVKVPEKGIFIAGGKGTNLPSGGAFGFLNFIKRPAEEGTLFDFSWRATNVSNFSGVSDAPSIYDESTKKVYIIGAEPGSSYSSNKFGVSVFDVEKESFDLVFVQPEELDSVAMNRRSAVSVVRYRGQNIVWGGGDVLYDMSKSLYNNGAVLRADSEGNLSWW